jgi:hypothetical protein
MLVCTVIGPTTGAVISTEVYPRVVVDDRTSPTTYPAGARCHVAPDCIWKDMISPCEIRVEKRITIALPIRSARISGTDEEMVNLRRAHCKNVDPPHAETAATD